MINLIKIMRVRKLINIKNTRINRVYRGRKTFSKATIKSIDDI